MVLVKGWPVELTTCVDGATEEGVVEGTDEVGGGTEDCVVSETTGCTAAEVVSVVIGGVDVTGG
jgi:hypothetical protein